MLLRNNSKNNHRVVVVVVEIIEDTGVARDKNSVLYYTIALMGSFSFFFS
jgi:hypothetical protein